MSRKTKPLARKWLTAIAIVTLIIASYLGWYWYHPLHPGEQTYEVRPGMTLRAFARELMARGVLREAHSFVTIATLTGRSRSLKVGEYRFPDGASVSAILDQVVAGRVVEYPLVLVEGWTFRQFQQALAQAPRLQQTLSGLSPAQVMERLGRAGEHWEGRFYPDTYKYSSGHTDLMILARAFERMQAQLESEWPKRDSGLPFKNPYEALILASIVEKETGKGEERPLIAGVFLNRLQRGMKLQTDPTVIYGLGERFDGNLRRRDLVTDTPYNTYTRTGMPPTPIAMPGGAAIRAVLHPAATRALYFVSRGDGSHVFSETLKDHNDAVIKYQLGGKPRTISTHPVTN
jgi:UPF0755 protein